MKRWIFFLLPLALVACIASTPNSLPTNPYAADLDPAPALVGDVWLNTTTPLRPEDLRDKVVLVDMWTFG